MLKLLAALILLTPNALANPIDRSVQELLKWEDTQTPGDVSDYAVTASMLGTLAYTAVNNSEKRWEKTGAAFAAYAANSGANYLAKVAFARERPNGVNKRSFYSGHTSTAFVGAGVICAQEKSIACPISVALAGTIGYLRIAANWHWFSDVVVGAGIGYAAGKFIPTLLVTF
jgi:membrane-associated phospholipid phosphatase